MPPYRKKKLPSQKPFHWIAAILIFAAVAFGWWLWRGLNVESPRFKSIRISVNRETQEISPGDTITLNPKDKVKIRKISTNVLFNSGIRLVSEGFDIRALRYEEMILSDLLPEKEIFDHYKFRIHVKFENKDLGYMDWEIRPYAEDWLEKVDSIEKGKERLAFLERALRLLPEDTQIRRRLIDEYKSQKEWKKASLLLKEIADKSPNQEILVELYEVYTTMGWKNSAISVLRRLVRLNPNDLGARVRLAEILEEKEQHKDAIKEYEVLLKRVRGKDKLPIFKSLGYLYTKTGQFKEAISYYQKAVEMDKKDVNLYYNLSYLYDKLNDKDKSDSYLSEALKLQPKDVEGRLKLAKRLTKRDKTKEAEQHLLEILKQKPDHREALMLLAKVYEKGGEKHKLKKVYERILLSDPKNDTILYNSGVLEYESGNLKGSIPYFRKYAELHPKDPGVREILFDIYKKLKNPQMAFNEAVTLAELKPDDMRYNQYIFNYLNNEKEYDKIIAVMKKRLKTNPKQTQLREYLILAYLKKGQEDLAINEMKEILKAQPKNVDVWLKLARLQEKQGKFPDALESYKHIIDISPDNEEAQEAYLRLRLKKVEGEEE